MPVENIWMPTAQEYKPAPYTVYLGLPLGSRKVDIGMDEARLNASNHPERFTIIHGKAKGDCTFDKLWCAALNIKAHRFSMIHGDVEPLEWYWLDIFWNTMVETKADLVAASVAMKDHTRRSSFGVADKNTPMYVTKLSLDFVNSLPSPFTIEEVKKAAPGLLATSSADWFLCFNTGLWLADITKPWVDDIDTWGSKTWITKDETGQRMSNMSSEDYRVSAILAQRDVKIVGINARDLRIKHYDGDTGYRNW